MPISGKEFIKLFAKLGYTIIPGGGKGSINNSHKINNIKYHRTSWIFNQSKIKTCWIFNQNIYKSYWIFTKNI